ncbi:TIGR02391 family protein [Prosthecochloris vibrioformis]|uniref:Conserved hypothetical protein CHP02391 domain-containing protein n=1 Tax=Prosthecochloris vibrioformis TaxID=1098 RepID=A0A5C4RSJ9_PROVB|nr:hypothetical protein FGF68_10075 [Prosthecochloris vibrioformis]
MSVHPPFDPGTVEAVVFTVEKPFLALNTRQTDTEKSEHKGFAQLLTGCAAAMEWRGATV